MSNSLMLLAIAIFLGIMVGFSYTNGAPLGQSLVRCSRYLIVVLTSLVLVGFGLASMKLIFAGAVALGVVFVVWLKLHLRRMPPAQLRGALAARPGESEPDLFPNDRGGWTLVYPDGVCVSYDSNGKFLEIES